MVWIILILALAGAIWGGIILYRDHWNRQEIEAQNAQREAWKRAEEQFKEDEKRRVAERQRAYVAEHSGVSNQFAYSAVQGRRQNSGKSNSEIVASIRRCKSKEDVPYKLIEAETVVEQKVQQSRTIVREAERQGYIKVSTVWMERFNELVEVSNTLNQNLILENERRTQMDRFYRYNDIWYRSVLMGNIAFNDYQSAKASLDEIGTVIDAIDRGRMRVNWDQKTKLYEIQDTFKKAKDILLKRVQSINAHTAAFRDKIGNECGERGRQWRAERMKGRR